MAPILAFSDYTRTFIPDTDASLTGIGAVLLREQENGEEKICQQSPNLS